MKTRAKRLLRKGNVTPKVEVENNEDEESIVRRDLLRCLKEEELSSTTEPADGALSCEICCKQFSRKGNLLAHIECHYDGKTPNCEKNRPYSCKECNKHFTAKRNLLKHLRMLHKDYEGAENLQVKKTRCPEKDCSFSCRKSEDLRQHIEKQHGIKILMDSLQFNSAEEFNTWKKEEEIKTVSWFVAFRQKNKLKSGFKKRTLVCHRTGQYTPKGTGRNRLKAHGSCKIGGKCPAAMEVVELPDGQLKVNYYKTHLGHTPDLIHLQLSKEDRQDLAEKIQQGFSLDAILEGIKESEESLTGKIPKRRLDILSRKDLYNIVQKNSLSKKGKSLQNLRNSPSISPLNLPALDEVTSKSDGLDSSKDSADGQWTLELDRVANEIELRSPVLDEMQDGSDSRLVSYSRQPSPSPLFGSLFETGSSTPQLLLISPDVNYRPVTELFLVHPNQFSASLLAPQYNAYIETTHENQILELTEETSTKPVRDINKINKENELRKRSICESIKEKLGRINQSVDNSEYLTPRQFEIVSSRLNSVLEIYDAIDRKNERKLARKKSIKNSIGDVSIRTGWRRNKKRPTPSICSEAPPSPMDNLSQMSFYAYFEPYSN